MNTYTVSLAPVQPVTRRQPVVSAPVQTTGNEDQFTVQLADESAHQHILVGLHHHTDIIEALSDAVVHAISDQHMVETHTEPLHEDGWYIAHH